MTMVDVTLKLPEDLVKAAQEAGIWTDNLIADLLEAEVSRQQINQKVKSSEDPLARIAGLADDDITDLSETVNQTMQDYYRKKANDLLG